MPVRAGGHPAPHDLGGHGASLPLARALVRCAGRTRPSTSPLQAAVVFRLELHAIGCHGSNCMRTPWGPKKAVLTVERGAGGARARASRGPAVRGKPSHGPSRIPPPSRGGRERGSFRLWFACVCSMSLDGIHHPLSHFVGAPLPGVLRASRGGDGRPVPAGCGQLRGVPPLPHRRLPAQRTGLRAPPRPSW